MAESYEVEGQGPAPGYQKSDLIKELVFTRRVNNLRNKLYEMVKDKLGIDTPKELFNRWLFCLMSNDFNFAQLLDTVDDLDANVIGRELLLSVPYRLQSDYEQCD